MVLCIIVYIVNNLYSIRVLLYANIIMKATTLCYPLDKGLDKGLDKEWIIKDQIGEESAYGTVYQACKDSKCNYVMKYQSYGEVKRSGMDFYNQLTKSDIEKEIAMQIAVAKIRLAPPLVDSWFCTNGGVIIMPMMQITIKRLLEIYNTIDLRLRILGNAIGLIQKLHDNGIYHGDTHLNNIMVNRDPDYEYDKDINLQQDFEEANYSYKFIDFGRSGYIKDTVKSEVIREDFVKLTTDIYHEADSQISIDDRTQYKYIGDFLSAYIKMRF